MAFVIISITARRIQCHDFAVPNDNDISFVTIIVEITHIGLNLCVFLEVKILVSLSLVREKQELNSSKEGTIHIERIGGLGELHAFTRHAQGFSSSGV